MGHKRKCGIPTKHFYEPTGVVVTGVNWVKLVEFKHSITSRVIYRDKSYLDKNNGILKEVKHGLSGTRIHSIWSGVMTRCYNDTDTAYKHYGGRGIKVDERWHDPEVFVYDMATTYREYLTLERIDHNGDYSKDNCKWVIWSEQARNKRTNRRITINGVTKIADDWAKEYGIRQNTIITRITKYGWEPEKAVTTPINKKYWKKNT